MCNDKLYLVTRADLSLGQRAVQAAHALRQFVAEHPEQDKRWFDASNYLALLEVPSENELGRLAWEAEEQGIRVARFHEPDRSNELTAIALEPG